MNQFDPCQAIARVTGSGVKHNWHKPHDTTEVDYCTGTGFLYKITDTTWYIMTAYHVVAEMSRLHVSFSFDKQKHSARVHGCCPILDVAIVTMEALPKKATKVIPLQSSNHVQMFDAVIVAGYPNGCDSLKMTKGIVSGRDRTLLQVDAPINPGNSGGPLLSLGSNDKTYQAVGVVVSHHEAKDGMGYVRPMAEILAHLDDMEAGHVVVLPHLNCKWGKSTKETRSYLGFFEQTGVLIQYSMQPPLQKNDILVQIENLEVNNDGEVKVSWWPEPICLKLYLWGKKVGTLLDITYWCFDEKILKTASITLKPKQFPLQRKFAFEKEISNEYEAMGGLIVTPLCRNLLVGNEAYVKRFQYIWSNLELRMKPLLVITFTCPDGTFMGSTTTVAPMDTIKSVNGVLVNTLEEYRQQLQTLLSQNEDTMVCIETGDGFYTCATVKKLKGDWPSLKSNYNFLSRVI